MIKYLTMTIEKQKNIALIAHDGKKQDMLKCVWTIKKFYSNIICQEPDDCENDSRSCRIKDKRI